MFTDLKGKLFAVTSQFCHLPLYGLHVTATQLHASGVIMVAIGWDDWRVRGITTLGGPNLLVMSGLPETSLRND
jgi:hypothetical protein